MRHILPVVIVALSVLPFGSAGAAVIKCKFGATDSGKCLAPPACQWGKTSSGACVDPRLGQWTQTGTLVLTQLQMNHNFSPYVPANPNVERIYSTHDVPFFQLFVNTTP
jgi:hypothetical protein